MENSIITYKYGFFLNGKMYGFRLKSLYCLSDPIPSYVKLCYNCGSNGWWINGEWVSFSLAKSITKYINKKVDTINFRFDIHCALLHGLEPNIIEYGSEKTIKKSHKLRHKNKTRLEMRQVINKLRKDL